MKKEDVERITQAVAERFSTFGGGRKSEWNPLANALAGKPMMFAAGVDVASVVRFIADEARKTTRG